MPLQPDPFVISEPGTLGLLAHVFQEHEFVHIYWDGEVYAATAIRSDDGKILRHTAAHESVLGLFRALATYTRDEPEPKRVCPGCNVAWGWSGFSANISGPGGKCRLCKICERKRVKKWTQEQALKNLIAGTHPEE